MKYVKKCIYRDDMDKDKTKTKPWEKDFMYEELGENGVFSEHLEIGELT
jgi:hypothetical protein